jgi:hypothetical protein
LIDSRTACPFVCCCSFPAVEQGQLFNRCDDLPRVGDAPWRRLAAGRNLRELQGQTLLAGAFRQALPPGQGPSVADELPERQPNQRPAAVLAPTELQRPAVRPLQPAMGFIGPLQGLLQLRADLDLINQLRITA